MSRSIYVKKSSWKSNRGDLILYLTESEKVISAEIVSTEGGAHQIMAIVEVDDN